MKANAITRIVIYCLMIAILLGVLIVGLTWEEIPVSLGGSISGILPAGQAADENQFSAAGIRQIIVLWVSGRVDVQGIDTEDICYQTNRGDNAPQTVYTLNGDCLTIAFTAQALDSKVKSKDLTVTLPRCWEGIQLRIETISADVSVTQLGRVGQLKTDTVSGALRISAVSTEKLTANTVSGEMEIAGAFHTIDLDGVSAGCTIDASALCPDSVTMDTVSGNLSLFLPDGYGFDLTMDAVNKSIHSNLSYTSEGSRYVSEGRLGLCRVDMNSVSGGASISSRTLSPAGCSHLWDEGVEADVPGDNRTERVYTCLLCGGTKSDAVSGSRRYQLCCADEHTASFLLEPLPQEYPAGQEVIVKTAIICDAGLHLYVNGEFVCSETAREDHWEFSFIMPEKATTIELRTHGGM